MELPKFGRSGGGQGGMLDGIKSKLGFAGADADAGYDQYYSDDDYDAYSDNYDDYSTYDEEEVEQSSYSSYAPVTTRSAGGSSRSLRSTSSSETTRSHPRLVSIDDVRANTQIPDRLNRDPLPARSTRTNGFSSRNTVGRASDYALSGSEVETPSTDNNSSRTEEGSRSGNLHSDGYDSLFGASTEPAASAISRPSSQVGINERPRSSYDPYTAYEEGSTMSHRPQRNLSVLKPVAYGEVESVARSLKAGDAVVLSLRNTPNQLSKRILDFSFGVASALDASVDCVADKVFVISRTSLSEAERTKLRNQGVL